MALMLIDVRPEVARFAVEMERRLRQNDHKPGWKRDDSLALYDRMAEESKELLLALAAAHNRSGMEEVIVAEAADVANFAMMIADVVGGL